jgi:hypothetical protein
VQCAGMGQVSDMHAYAVQRRLSCSSP